MFFFAGKDPFFPCFVIDFYGGIIYNFFIIVFYGATI